MGEVVFSIFIGGILAVSGIFMNLILKKEERQILSEQKKSRPKADKLLGNDESKQDGPDDTGNCGHSS